MKLTQKQILIKYLQYVGDFIPAYKLRSVNTPFGWLGFQADRRCRELANEGKIERRLERGFVSYRIKSNPPIQVLKSEARIQTLKLTNR